MSIATVVINSAREYAVLYVKELNRGSARDERAVFEHYGDAQYYIGMIVGTLFADGAQADKERRRWIRASTRLLARRERATARPIRVPSRRMRGAATQDNVTSTAA